jgi:hypothetical protein
MNTEPPLLRGIDELLATYQLKDIEELIIEHEDRAIHSGNQGQAAHLPREYSFTCCNLRSLNPRLYDQLSTQLN